MNLLREIDLHQNGQRRNTERCAPSKMVDLNLFARSKRDGGIHRDGFSGRAGNGGVVCGAGLGDAAGLLRGALGSTGTLFSCEAVPASECFGTVREGCWPAGFAAD